MDRTREDRRPTRRPGITRSGQPPERGPAQRLRVAPRRWHGQPRRVGAPSGCSAPWPARASSRAQRCWSGQPTPVVIRPLRDAETLVDGAPRRRRRATRSAIREKGWHPSNRCLTPWIVVAMARPPWTHDVGHLMASFGTREWVSGRLPPRPPRRQVQLVVSSQQSSRGLTTRELCRSMLAAIRSSCATHPAGCQSGGPGPTAAPPRGGPRGELVV